MMLYLVISCLILLLNANPLKIRSVYILLIILSHFQALQYLLCHLCDRKTKEFWQDLCRAIIIVPGLVPVLFFFPFFLIRMVLTGDCRTAIVRSEPDMVR